MSDYKFEFVVEGMTKEQADELGNMIIQAVESIGLICGGNTHGVENYLHLKCIDDRGCKNYLTVGKEYLGMRLKNFIQVISDDGRLAGFCPDRFEEV